MAEKKGLKIKAAGSRQADVGRGIVRLASKQIQALSLERGDVVEIKGKKTTGAMKKNRSLAEAFWKTLSSREIYQNPWLSLREDRVELPDGRQSIYGVVTCGHCVGVLPFVDPETVLLVKQYRYVAKRVTWEMPTGGVHAGETNEEAAQRELGEEVGCRAGRLEWLSTYHTSKSVMDETAHLYIGADLAKLRLQPDETEFLEVRPFPFREVLQMVLRGEVLDSMTIIAVLHAAWAKRPGKEIFANP